MTIDSKFDGKVMRVDGSSAKAVERDHDESCLVAQEPRLLDDFGLAFM